ncbi:DUF6886 family protein [Numidum massiliense]|uniref:DUF6886 family protein n=1 Tax=Numidum massiliense TaxID=1522315 RepID=UPI0006D5469F|nr:DUF6886 family protein [Numidum massiliense]
MNVLYHFSEDPHIDEFVPRATNSRKHLEPVVWAIDAAHAVNYYFPRDCPRIVYSRTTNISREDEERFFGHTEAHTVITVESKWYEAIRSTTLYKYTFDGRNFQLCDEIAGYYVSNSTVRPLAVEPMGDLIQAIVRTGVDLRFTPNLYRLRDALVNSTLRQFSIIRFRNTEH